MKRATALLMGVILAGGSAGCAYDGYGYGDYGYGYGRYYDDGGYYGRDQYRHHDRYRDRGYDGPRRHYGQRHGDRWGRR